jgi:hypothetical protein
MTTVRLGLTKRGTASLEKKIAGTGVCNVLSIMLRVYREKARKLRSDGFPPEPGVSRKESAYLAKVGARDWDRMADIVAAALKQASKP